MHVEIGHLEVRTRADGRDSGRALAARTRLVTVARGPLPAALERALSGLGGAGDSEDLVIDRLVVPLEFDPLEHDLDTLAVLWADAIQAAARARFAVAATGGETPASGGAAAGDRPAPTPAATTPSGTAAFVVALERAASSEVAALARRLTASLGRLDALMASLPPDRRRRVLAILGAAAAAGRRASQPTNPRAASPGPGPATDGTGADRPDRGGSTPDPDAATSTWRDAWRHAASLADPEDVAPDDRTASAVDDLERLAAAATVPPPRRHTESRHLLGSRAGGLILLYPWLASHLDGAVDRLDHLDPPTVRRCALAMLVAPDDLTIQHDPLVRLLAGLPPLAATDTCLEVAEVTEADALLVAFAELLPGLGGSSPAWIRHNVIARPAGLEDRGGAWQISLAPGAFDPLLRHLPYPLGTFRLPWTSTLHGRLEAR